MVDTGRRGRLCAGVRSSGAGGREGGGLRERLRVLPEGAWGRAETTYRDLGERVRLRFLLLRASGLLLAVLCVAAVEQRSEGDDAPRALSVKEVAAKVLPSIVVIRFAGREGAEQGLGTGFIIDSGGLIATNLHVIGEARRITVTRADGSSLPVTAIHASDRGLDLAILQVEGKDLPALALAEGDEAPPGEPVVVMGNPQGLKHSVVSGVVSAAREIEGRNFLQLAIPVEPGNSGGPVLDMQGRVLGVVSMKSAVTENLAFAATVGTLRTLLEKPNPVPLERWLTLGAVDGTQWEALFGAQWQQRSSRILVDGPGAGFGGRSLLLAKAAPPELPYEVAVEVKLNDEAGAAGLVFQADGGQRHYGFYPSNGRLRLSRFDGPDVFSWQVLAEKPSEHYRPGQWNHLKVRMSGERIECFVNDRAVIESTDRGLRGGRVGLAKFRDTGAAFRRFEVGAKVAGGGLDEEATKGLAMKLTELPPLAEITDGLVNNLAAQGAGHQEAALALRAREMVARARELDRLAADVRTAATVAELGRHAGPEAERIDLARAALAIARLDEEDLDVESYVSRIERMAGEVRKKLSDAAADADKLAALNEYLFRDNGFHGSRTDYYDRANSYLSRVIDDREGMPITLAVLYIELASRLGLKVQGVALPAHFVVQFVPQDGKPQLIDVFEGGKLLSREEAEKKIFSLTGEATDASLFEAASERQILKRVLGNLIAGAQQPKTGVDREALIRYESAMLAIDPTLVRDRGLRAVCRWETGRRAAAVADLQVLIDAKPAGVDVEELRKMQRMFLTTLPSAAR